MPPALTAGRGNSPDAENNAKLLRELAGFPTPQWTARFRCALALVPVRPGQSAGELAAQTEGFEGLCEGRITAQPSGTAGFGYDPLFVPAGHTASFAELGAAVKQALSHRAHALALLQAHFSRLSAGARRPLDFRPAGC